MHLLCTSPIKENWAEELTALGATVTTLEFDGTFEAADDAKFDGAMITSEAFKLYFQGGMSALSVPYDALSALVRSGHVAWVHVCASGLDVPVFFPLMRACHETGTTLTHCPGVYGIPIAQYCIGHMLSVCRMIPQHAINQASRKCATTTQTRPSGRLRNDMARFHGRYESLVQRDIRTCTVGIVGAGGIGAELAKLSKAFGMGTIGWRRNAAPAPNYDEMLSGPDGLDRLLSASKACNRFGFGLTGLNQLVPTS
jgi:phosphoglycerate dehydrogenase-like enzyme